MDENSKLTGDGGPPKTSSTAASAAADDSTDMANPNFDSNNSNIDSNEEALGTSSDLASARSRHSSRTPFTNLSQEDADLALARTLQEQERAYMMLSMNGGVAGYGRWNTGIYLHDDEDDDFGDPHDHDYDEDDDDEEDDDEAEDDHDGYDDEEDAFDVHARAASGENNVHGVELNPSDFPDDEAYARALQDAEEREMAARLLAIVGLTEREIVDVEELGGNSQDTWEEVDPDELSYEELLALGEVVGTESRGLSAETIASLTKTKYKVPITQATDCDSCVICRLDYEDGDALTTLPCKHPYHSECINNWLKINKACPVCSTEVSSSGSS